MVATAVCGVWRSCVHVHQHQLHVLEMLMFDVILMLALNCYYFLEVQSQGFALCLDDWTGWALEATGGLCHKHTPNGH